MIRNDILDRSEELIVQRWGTGVRLVSPDDFDHEENSIPASVSSLFKMPFNVYFLNTESIIQNMSDTTAHICGFQEKKDAIGNTARAVSKKESAEFSIRHNKEVIARNSIVIKDEHFLRLDDYEFRDIAIKFPLLNTDEKIIGVFGCSIINEILPESLNLLMKTGLLSTSWLPKEKNDYPILSSSTIHTLDVNELGKKLNLMTEQYISKREIECLFYLLRGKSARETGLQLHLSQRTVEHYLNSLKDKLNCSKKSQIIETVFSLLKS